MTTMNRKQLLAILRYLGAPGNTYDLGTNMRLDVCYDMEYTEQGWEVYLTERGSKFEIERFDTETDACLKLLYGVVHWRKAFIQTTVNLRQLRSILAYLQVPEERYNFHGGYYGTNCFSIEWTAQGWEVFFSANGEKRDIAVFGNETDACLDPLYKVMHL